MSSLKPEKPTYWRSFAELENRPEFRELAEREFATPLEELPPNSPARRRFMQIMAASTVLAGCRYEKDYLRPHVSRPEGHVPGETVEYATMMDHDGVAIGLLATSYEGRPIKLEGNPMHPTSGGAAGVYQQAAILSLYDPDRSKSPARYQGGKRVPAEWKAFDAFATKHMGAAKVAILADTVSSPTRRALKKQFLAKFPQARWFEYEPLSKDNVREGSKLAFGAVKNAIYHFDHADVVVTLDANIMGDEPGALAYGAAVAKRRNPAEGTMSRMYAVEHTMTPTGTIADHRLPLRAELVKALAVSLDARLGGGSAEPAAGFLKDAKVKAFVDAVVADLQGAKGKSVVVAGAHQPAEVHALVHRINSTLGSVGTTVTYWTPADADRPAHLADIADLAKNAGSFDTLLILGGNPVENAPADLDFKGVLGKIKHTVHLAETEDETSRACSWHLPRTHWLETWNDGVGHDGTVAIGQPLIAPLYEGRSDIEFLARLVQGKTTEETVDVAALIRKTHGLTDDKAWRKAIHDGVIAAEAHGADGHGDHHDVAAHPAGHQHETPTLQAIPAVTLAGGEVADYSVGNGKLEVVFGDDGKVYDGRWSNNAWLQELPESFTKLTWDNAVLISPKTAKELGVSDGHVVTVSVGGKSVTLPALMSPGVAPGTLRLAIGYGRDVAGHVAGLAEEAIAPVGVSVRDVRSTKGFFIAGGASVKDTGTMSSLALTQDLHAIDTTGKQLQERRAPDIIREATLDDYKRVPDFPKNAVHHPPLLNLWQDPVSYANGHKWGMSIDLNKCTGCNACVVACQAENNIPVVGKKMVSMGREMHWIRVDRYYKGSPEDPEVSFQPVACQQCENAPCEQVCPVGATVHSHEGLNDMVYNRCIGTRYCSNNCPYKVRRFNYHNYHLQEPNFWMGGINDPKNDSRKLAFNPNVTVRVRGVMEKCTFCVQRIQKAKIKNKNAAVQSGDLSRRTHIDDGVIKTACQQTCATGAIVFGDLNDKEAAVTRKHASTLSYDLLGELNNRPRNKYLGRVRNPNAKLGPKVTYEVKEGHHGGHGDSGHGDSGHGDSGHGDSGHGDSGHGDSGHGKPAGHDDSGHGKAAGHGSAKPHGSAAPQGSADHPAGSSSAHGSKEH